MIDHPEGTPLEVTLETARQMKQYLAGVPEVKNLQLYAGNAAPYNFNGLVRHYFLRRSPQWADLQVNLSPKGERSAQSHEIAKRVRPALVEIAKRRGAQVKVVEIPPGPPVMDTMVAEVYGPTAARPPRRRRSRCAASSRRRRASWTCTTRWRPSAAACSSSVDREKAGLKGIPAMAAVETLAGPGAGPRRRPGIDAPVSREPVPVRVRLSAADRASRERRLSLRVDSPMGGQVAIGELREPRAAPEPQPLVRKDLKPVVYVMGDLAGERESPVYAIAGAQREARRAEAAGRRRARALLGRAAGDLGPARDEVGRRVADHLRGVPRPGHRLRGGAGADRDPRDRLVPVLRGAARDPAADPAVADRHPARALGASARSSPRPR